MPKINRIFLGLVGILAAIPLMKLAAGDLGGYVTVMQQVMPAEARAGEIVTVTGFALDADHLKEVYLTNGETDFRAEIVEQGNVAVRVRIPAKITPGRMTFAIVVASRAEMLEQPVFIKILPSVG